jgi:hypothetical protein
VKKQGKTELDLEIKNAKSILGKNIENPKKRAKYPKKFSIILPHPRIRCLRNPNIDVEKIPYMSYYFAKFILKDNSNTIGQLADIQTSNDFFNISVLDKYQQITCGQSFSIEDRQALLNALRIGRNYANGKNCPSCTQTEALMKAVPGLRIEAAKLMIAVWGSSYATLHLLNIDATMSGVDGLDWTYALYDWAFQIIDLCPIDAAILFEGLLYGVHLLNKTTLSPGPGGIIPRNPP